MKDIPHTAGAVHAHDATVEGAAVDAVVPEKAELDR